MKRICKQCGKEFVLTQNEIAFYQSKNLHIPKRCEQCRRENKVIKMTGNDYEAERTSGQVVKAYNGQKSGRKKSWAVIVAVIVLLAVGIGGFQMRFLSDRDEVAAGSNPIQEVQTLTSVEPAAGSTKNVSDDVLPDKDDVEAETWTETQTETQTEIQTKTETQIKPETDAEITQKAETEIPVPNEAVSETAAPSSQVYTYNFRKAEYLQEHFEKHGAEFGYTVVEDYLAGANRVIASTEALHKTEAEDGDDVYYLESTNEFVIVSTDGYLRTYFKPSAGKAFYDRQ